MSTFNSALFVINETYADEYVRQHMTPLEVTKALDGEGLLAPDLPEANDTSLPLPTKSWVLDAEGAPVVWSAPGTTVMIQRVEPGDLFPAQARRFALNILAAADYAERHHHE